MLKNYFKVAWRNLLRNKSFSAINIAGLALGMVCSLLIVLWVQDERATDQFHANGQQLFQVYERNFFDGKLQAGYSTQGLLAQELKRVIPEIVAATGVEEAAPDGTLNNFEAAGKINKMKGAYAAPDFFSMFSFPLLSGTAATSLNNIESIAISRSMAQQFFGDANKAIGQTMLFENKDQLKVTAVFEDMPANASMHYDFLRSWSAFIQENKWVNNWGNTDPVTYVQLHKSAKPTQVQALIKDFIYRYQKKDNSYITELALQPYPEKYLHANFTNGVPDGGRIEYVRLFTLIAAFILLIACINFMNLATARSASRAKEVGLRKVIGALRRSLVAQFIGEAVLLTAMATAVALLIAALLLPYFNQLTGKQLSIPVTQPMFWLALLLLLVLTGTVAGSYPAFFLSSLQPVKVLKGSFRFSRAASFFSKGLVVFQFTLSILLMVGMIVIYRQMNYIQSKNIGYKRENLVYIPIEGELIKNYGPFKQSISKLPGIVSVSKMRNSPTVIGHHNGSISWPGKSPNLAISFADAVVGYDFIQTLQLQLKEGRDFSPAFGTDSASFLINETAAAKMGFTQAVGQNISWGNHPGKIIGVIKDFHFTSMHDPIEPLVVRLDEKWGWGTILVRTTGDPRVAIAGLAATSKAMNPKIPFTYQFSDQEFARLYKSEAMVSKLSGWFAFLAIFISCMGLFGLATFTAAQRTKEIGVRKVLGATVPDIVRMFSGDFVRLVVIALLLACPAAWYLMNNWLDHYAYKINISWWVFGIAGAATLCITLLTVSYQGIKAANSNPVKSLRNE
ncbi:MAG TPA: ABC transporter permease [Chitinophagaceae bacterium]|nr:ABC transporter permease [Chitinophagaceae bacterium]